MAIPRLFATTAIGQSVNYYGDSHAAQHFRDNPALLPLAKQAIRMTSLEPQKRAICFDFKRIVGKTDLVQTGPEDEIVYAKRNERGAYARFVRGREPRDCATVSLVFKPPQRSGQGFLLVSAWIGPLTPPFPNRYRAEQAWRDFWAGHALVWGSQSIVSGTATSRCPW